jgi:hypothetical protein
MIHSQPFELVELAAAQNVHHENTVMSMSGIDVSGAATDQARPFRVLISDDQADVLEACGCC